MSDTKGLDFKSMAKNTPTILISRTLNNPLNLYLHVICM